MAAGDGKVFLLTSEDIECLDAGSGKRRWRIERPALPDDAVRRLGYSGMYEFLLSVLMYLDGGIYVYAVEPATGKVLHREVVYSPDPETGKMATEPSAQAMTGLLNDVPGSDGENVFIRQMDVSSGDDHGGTHLFTTAGYLDPTWFNRTFWKMGHAQTTGPMVLGDGRGLAVHHALRSSGRATRTRFGDTHCRERPPRRLRAYHRRGTAQRPFPTVASRAPRNRARSLKDRARKASAP